MKTKFANFGEEIANFRFRRKSDEISVHLLFERPRNFASKVMNRNEISRQETKFRNEISCLQDEISLHGHEISFRQGEISSAETKSGLSKILS